MSATGAPHANLPGGSPTDENLTDDDLRCEIEMVSDLVVAATSSDGPLNQHEVDLLLGVDLRMVEPAADPDS